MSNFTYRNEILHIDNVSALDIEKQCKTPVYIYSKSRLINNFQKLEGALTSKLGKNYPKLIAYSVIKGHNLHPYIKKESSN